MSKKKKQENIEKEKKGFNVFFDLKETNYPSNYTIILI